MQGLTHYVKWLLVILRAATKGISALHQVIAPQAEAGVQAQLQECGGVMPCGEFLIVPEQLLALHRDTQLCCDGDLDVCYSLVVVHPVRQGRASWSDWRWHLLALEEAHNLLRQ